MAVEPLALASPAKVRAALGLSQEKMSHLLGCSSKTLARWERGGSAPGSQALEVLSRLEAIAGLATSVYTPEGVNTFLFSPMAPFGGSTAYQLISIGQSEKVLSALAADYEGLGY